MIEVKSRNDAGRTIKHVIIERHGQHVVYEKSPATGLVYKGEASTLPEAIRVAKQAKPKNW